MTVIQNIEHSDGIVATDEVQNNRKSKNGGTEIQFAVSDNAVNHVVHVICQTRSFTYFVVERLACPLHIRKAWRSGILTERFCCGP
jgi:hypothetical protein